MSARRLAVALSAVLLARSSLRGAASIAHAKSDRYTSMSNLVRLCRSGKIKSPNQLSFDPRTWTSSFATGSQLTDEERNLRDSGIWFHHRFSDLRSVLTGSRLETFHKADFASVVVGALNYANHAAKKQLQELFTARGAVTFDTGVAGGYEHVVSAARHVLAYPQSFSEKIGLIEPSDLVRVNSSLALAIVYDNYDAAWSKCLWRGWHVLDDGVSSSILPRSQEREELREIAFARYEELNLQEQFLISEVWKDLPQFVRDRICKGVVEATGIAKDLQGSITVTLAAAPSTAEHIPRHVLHFTMVEQPYIKAVLDLPFEHTPQLNLNVVMKAFSALSSVASLLDDDMGVTPFTPSTLPQFAPVITKQELLRIVSQDVSLNSTSLDRLLELFTYRWTSRDDLWHRPLVPITEDKFALLVAPLTAPNPNWLLEYWMREGGIDLAKRGEPFEQQVRSELTASCKLANSCVYDKSIRLTHGSQFEQIDLLARIGNKVIVGEVKCSVFPTRSQDYDNYESRLADGAAQALRKVAFARKCKSQLVKLLGKNIDSNREIEFTPVVVTNLPLGLGQSYSGVPVVDLLTLKRYFDSGELPTFVTQDAKTGKRSTPMKTVRFYENALEAERNIDGYLVNPPSLRLFRSMLKETMKEWVGLKGWQSTASWMVHVDTDIGRE